MARAMPLSVERTLGVVGEVAGEADGFTLLGHGVAPWERLRSLSLED
jgi:hypothetical protein